MEEKAKRTAGRLYLPGDIDPSILETISYEYPGRKIKVELASSEFTCVCPATGQPDFARLTIRYIPNKRILESKSLKLYVWSFRDEGVFHEHVTNVILDDIVGALNPRWCMVNADFSVRGGISISVHAEYGHKQEDG